MLAVRCHLPAAVHYGDFLRGAEGAKESADLSQLCHCILRAGMLNQDINYRFPFLTQVSVISNIFDEGNVRNYPIYFSMHIYYDS